MRPSQGDVGDTNLTSMEDDDSPPPPPPSLSSSSHPFIPSPEEAPAHHSMNELLYILENPPIAGGGGGNSSHPESRGSRLEAFEARLSALLTQHGAGTTPAAEFAKDVVDQLKKGVSFTANVAGGALRLNELKGVPQAPTVSREALDLSTAAVKVLESEMTSAKRGAGGTLADAFGRIVTRASSQELALHLPSASLEYTIDMEPSRVPTEHPPAPPPPPSPPRFSESMRITVGGSPTSEESEATEDRSLLLQRHALPAQAERKVAGVSVVELARKQGPSPPVNWAISLESPVLERFTLMTFNAGLLEYRLAGVNCYANPPFTKRRLYQLPLNLKAFAADVVCLQEIYDDWQANFLGTSLKGTYPFVARRRSGGTFALHNGLMVLSRFPIMRIEFHPFHSVTSIERFFGSKGMLECTVEVPTVGRVTVVNIHLASGAVDPESKALESLRNHELEQALEVSRCAVTRGEYPIIIGDLNAAPNLCATNYECLLQNGFCDGFLTAVCKECHPSPQADLAQLGSLREEELGGTAFRLSHSQSLIKPPSGRPQKIGRKQQRFKVNRRPSPLRQEVTATASTAWNDEEGSEESEGKQRKKNHVALPVLSETSNDDEGEDFLKRRVRKFKWRKYSRTKFPPDPTKKTGHQPLLGRQERRRSSGYPPWPPLLRRGESAPVDSAGLLHPLRTRTPSNGKNNANSCQRIIATANRTMRGQSPFSPSRVPRKFLQLLKNAGVKRGDSSSQQYDDDFEQSAAPSTNSPRQPCCPGRPGWDEVHSPTCPEMLKSMKVTHPQIVNVDGDGVLEFTPVKVNLNHDPFCTALFTWDPKNPLNAIGPHSACHGLRCDHIFLPASTEMSPNGKGLLSIFKAEEPRVLFTEPRVTVEGCCCGLLGRGQLVTLSDHYGLAVTLLRRRVS